MALVEKVPPFSNQIVASSTYSDRQNMPNVVNLSIACLEWHLRCQKGFQIVKVTFFLRKKIVLLMYNWERVVIHVKLYNMYVLLSRLNEN